MPLQRKSRVDISQRARDRGALAAIVNARRQELGLSQVELADLAGVSPTFVHNLEAGRTQVGLDRLLAVLETVGLHLQVEREARREVTVGAAIARQFGLEADGESSHERNS